MKILVARDFNETLRTRKTVGSYSQRILWFVEDGDIVILPQEPDWEYVEYVAKLTNTALQSLTILWPAGEGHLTPSRLLSVDTISRTKEAIAGRKVDRLISLWSDAAVSHFSSAIGQRKAFSGADFFAQSGDMIGSSKAAFRMLAAGNGVPIAPGAVCGDVATALQALDSMLRDGRPVMLKHEFMSGGWGNEIITRGDPVKPMGAHRMTALTGNSGVSNYLNERWPALTGGGRHKLVVEEFIPNSRSVFAEYSIDDDGHRLGAIGSLVTTVFEGSYQVIPDQDLSEDESRRLVHGAEILCRVLHTAGYRGIMSADAIICPDGRLMFTEANGRVTGSTHTYQGIGKRVIGPMFGPERLIVERTSVRPWNLETFGDAVSGMEAAGLAYSDAEKAGVLIVVPRDEASRSFAYCVVAADLDEAASIDSELTNRFIDST